MIPEIILKTLTENLLYSSFTLVLVSFLVYYAVSILSVQLSLIGDKLKLSPGIKGATFDAIGGSLPEFFIAIVSLFILGEKGLEIGIGTIGGSAIFNILIIPFFSILFYKKNKIKKIHKNDINRDIIFFIISVFILYFGFLYNLYLLTGISLILVYIGYIVFLFHENNIYKNEHLKKVNKKFNNVINDKISIIKIIIGIFILYIGVELSVHSILYIAGFFGISNLLISMILLAIITSMPDLFLGIKTSTNGRIDSSFGNAVGSNIFNICIGLGVPLLIGIGYMGISFDSSIRIDNNIFFFLIISALIFTYLGNEKRLNRKHAYYLLFIYIIFIISIL